MAAIPDFRHLTLYLFLRVNPRMEQMLIAGFDKRKSVARTGPGRTHDE